MQRIDREKQTVRQMIHMYCRNKEGNRELCPDCRRLTDYAMQRLSACPFGNGKSTCRKCTVHCYSPSMRLRMRDVMRFAGPRMLLYHPIAAVRHIMAEWLPAPKHLKSRYTHNTI